MKPSQKVVNAVREHGFQKVATEAMRLSGEYLEPGPLDMDKVVRSIGMRVGTQLAQQEAVLDGLFAAHEVGL